jgi:hypothetical protein
MKIERGDLKMRKHTVLTMLVLAFSVMVGIQLVTSDVRANDIRAKVNITPETLVWKAEGFGNYMTVTIKLLSEEYNVHNISISSIVITIDSQQVPFVRSDIEEDTLVLKIERELVLNILESMALHMSPHVKREVPVEVTGKLCNDNAFHGSDTFEVFITQPIQP